MVIEAFFVVVNLHFWVYSFIVSEFNCLCLTSMLGVACLSFLFVAAFSHRFILLCTGMMGMLCGK